VSVAPATKQEHNWGVDSGAETTYTSCLDCRTYFEVANETSKLGSSSGVAPRRHDRQD